MIFVVDFISPLGHKKLNSFFLNILREEGVRAHFLFKSNYFSSSNNSDIITFADLPSLKFLRSSGSSDSQGVLSYIEAFFYTFYLVFYLLSRSRPNRKKKIFFTSYNCFSHLICFFVLKKILNFDIYVFEHNSIPSSSGRLKEKLKRLFFRFSSSFITHIVFESYISDYLNDTYNSKSVVVLHPCLSEKEDDVGYADEVSEYLKADTKFVFSPSGSTSASVISFFDDSLHKNKEFVFVVKSGSYISPFPTTLVRSSFRFYYSLLSKCSCVVIGCDFEYRVSGVFYEALALSKPIILTKSVFSSNVKRLYPNVFIFDQVNVDEVMEFISNFVPEIFDFKLHNISSKKSFLRFVND